MPRVLLVAALAVLAAVAPGAAAGPAPDVTSGSFVTFNTLPSERRGGVGGFAALAVGSDPARSGHVRVTGLACRDDRSFLSRCQQVDESVPGSVTVAVDGTARLVVPRSGAGALRLTGRPGRLDTRVSECRYGSLSMLTVGRRHDVAWSGSIGGRPYRGRPGTCDEAASAASVAFLDPAVEGLPDAG